MMTMAPEIPTPREAVHFMFTGRGESQGYIRAANAGGRQITLANQTTLMFSKSLLALVSTVMCFRAASAQITGTATRGFNGTTNCGCPPFNGPFAISIPAGFLNARVCCQDTITVNYNGKSVQAILSGVYDAQAGTTNIELTDTPFSVLQDNANQQTISPVTWQFDQSPH
ncbi:hypothetical protein B0H13DRAFT_2046556 [Mycena leptocephala]|nr:hypothetical protein B0H13DRAFT_2098575 [Mycena leptocephala]KAJ7883366.1 hypothetical protein B0H13DRAFT_2046556 [Mycena leptocephala]